MPHPPAAGGGLDPATTAADLQELFGRVAPCTVALRRPQRQPSASGGPRLFAYISYATAEQAAVAQQQLDRLRLHGRSLRVMPRLWQPEGAARGVRALGVRLELQVRPACSAAACGGPRCPARMLRCSRQLRAFLTAA